MNDSADSAHPLIVINFALSFSYVQLCGSEFPEKCGYTATAIYSCPDALVKPVLIEECPPGLVCANEQNGPTCHSDLCHCHSGDIGKNVRWMTGVYRILQ